MSHSAPTALVPCAPVERSAAITTTPAADPPPTLDDVVQVIQDELAAVNADLLLTAVALRVFDRSVPFELVDPCADPTREP